MLDEPMARHCSWRTGGCAERFFQPADLEDLVGYLKRFGVEETLTWIGLGSNLLVRDGGLSGTVISTAKSLNNFRWLDATRIVIECGVPCAKVAREVARKRLTGGSFLAGIPGTIGGALAMNAGAFGRETWMLVESVTLVDEHGLVSSRDKDHFEVSYRCVDLPAEHWFVKCVLRFSPTTSDSEEQDIRDLLAKRNASQPTGKASCGSVFKNPPGDFAGRLIEEAGLKGVRQGGCHVSTKHANFIINDEDANATDIEALIREIQRRVAENSGIALEPEVRIVGRRKTSVGSVN